jgi:hypothetical protein
MNIFIYFERLNFQIDVISILFLYFTHNRMELCASISTILAVAHDLFKTLSSSNSVFNYLN